MRIAVTLSGSAPAVAIRSNVSFRLRPASTRIRVSPAETSAQLPALEDARTVMETMAPKSSLRLMITADTQNVSEYPSSRMGPIRYFPFEEALGMVLQHLLLLGLKVRIRRGMLLSELRPLLLR